MSLRKTVTVDSRTLPGGNAEAHRRVQKAIAAGWRVFSVSAADREGRFDVKLERRVGR